MAMIECKECRGQVSQNADTCPHCGDVINEPKPKFSLVDLIHKISVPVVLSVAGTLITILTYFSMEGERQMEQTRKLLADAFDKDPIKQQYCIFYVDHLLASGRISPQMTVSVLTTVAANATNENVRLDALRMMPELLEQRNYQEELKPLLVRRISSLIPNLTEVEVLRKRVMLDIQTLVEADESYRKPLIAELSSLDRSWSLINNKPEGNLDQKEIRVGLQIKLALLALFDHSHDKSVGMNHALRQHWPEYICEATALVIFMFMISASVCTALFEYPASPLRLCEEFLLAWRWD